MKATEVDPGIIAALFVALGLAVAAIVFASPDPLHGSDFTQVSEAAEELRGTGLSRR